MNNYKKLIELKKISDDFFRFVVLAEFARWCKENNLKPVQSNMDKFLADDSLDLEKIEKQCFGGRPGSKSKKNKKSESEV